MAGLKQFRLRGESLLVLLLVPQLVLPVARLQGVAASVAYWSWLATFPLLIGLCLWNRSVRPLWLVAAGLALNALVIVLNGGMPVSVSAVAAATGGAALLIHVGDFAHVAMSASTRLPWLGDVLPLPGPIFMRAVASPGDLLLACGASASVAAATVAGLSRRRAQMDERS